MRLITLCTTFSQRLAAAANALAAKPALSSSCSRGTPLEANYKCASCYHKPIVWHALHRRGTCQRTLSTRRAAWPPSGV